MTDLTIACDVLDRAAEGFHAASGYLRRAALTAEHLPATITEFGYLPADRGLLGVYQHVVQRMHDVLSDGDEVFRGVADLLLYTARQYRTTEGHNAVGITKAGE